MHLCHCSLSYNTTISVVFLFEWKVPWGLIVILWGSCLTIAMFAKYHCGHNLSKENRKKIYISETVNRGIDFLRFGGCFE